MYWKLINDVAMDEFVSKVIYGVCIANSQKDAAGVFDSLIREGIVRAPVELLEDYEKTILEATEEEYEEFLNFVSEHI